MNFDLSKVPEICPEITILMSDDREDFCFLFNVGPFEGISFVYANVRFNQRDDGQMEVDFVPVPLHNQHNITYSHEDFRQATGDILVRIVNAAGTD